MAARASKLSNTSHRYVVKRAVSRTLVKGLSLSLACLGQGYI